MSRISMGRQTVGSLFWIAVGVFFTICISDLRIGSLKRPGPAFLPICMSILLIFLNFVDLIKALREPPKDFGGIMWRRPGFVLISLFVFCLIFSLLGFPSATFILMVVLFSLLITPRRNKWVSVILYASMTSVVAWLVFQKALGIYFP